MPPSFLDELPEIETDTPDDDVFGGTDEADPFADEPGDWKTDWQAIPPNVKPEFHEKAKAHHLPKGDSPEAAYAGLLKKQGGKLKAGQVISIGAQLDPFASGEAEPAPKAAPEAPKTNGKAKAEAKADPKAAVNPPKRATPKPAPAEVEAPLPELNDQQLMLRNTIVVTRVVPSMQDNDIEALIAFATKVAVKL